MNLLYKVLYGRANRCDLRAFQGRVFPWADGQTLAHFRFEEVIAKDSTGMVCRAQDTEHDRVVAVKVLEPALPGMKGSGFEKHIVAPTEHVGQAPPDAIDHSIGGHMPSGTA